MVAKHRATSATTAIVPADQYGLNKTVKQPKDARAKKFCQNLALGMEVRQAAMDAGYSASWAKVDAYRVKKQYAEYVTWLHANIAKEVATQLVIDHKTVFEEIARLGLMNEADYIVIEDVTEKVEGKEVKRTRARRKELHELTREQMSCIRVTGSGANLSYELLDKEGNLIQLAKMLGLLNEKVILEHRLGSAQKEGSIDWSKMPIDKLMELEKVYEGEFEEIGVSTEAR